MIVSHEDQPSPSLPSPSFITNVKLNDNMIMRGDRFASSSTQESSTTDPITALLTEFGDTLSRFGNVASDGPEGKWAGTLVLECAKAIANKAMERVEHLLWMLNELASPYGDCEQRVAFYFLEALFCKTSGSGLIYYGALCAAMERRCSFDSLRRTILKFQEASPWTTFGHVASNGAILEAFDGESKVHILDVSNTLCTQWPTLLEALATRTEGAPSLRLTTVIIPQEISSMKAMKEVGTRLERFARLMGVPFEFKVHQELDMAKLHDEHQLTTLLDLQPGEALAINCNQSLHLVPGMNNKKFNKSSSSADEQCVESIDGDGRDEILQTLRRMNPKVLTLVEEEADIGNADFIASLSEALRFYSLYFEMLEASFLRVSDERLMLERAAARSMLNLLACAPYRNHDEDDASSGHADILMCERREISAQWDARLIRAGFSKAPFSDDAMDDVRALLKRYREGWGLTCNDAHTCLQLTWSDQSTLFASAWKCC